jgi:DNA-binding protein WhiA
MNNKIEKDLKNTANRQSNCELYNIQKTVTASGRVLNAINALKDANLLSTLPEELENTAQLRLKYPDYSLARLASVFTPPISKPGLSHRLNKIVEFAEKVLVGKDE